MSAPDADAEAGPTADSDGDAEAADAGDTAVLGALVADLAENQAALSQALAELATVSERQAAEQDRALDLLADLLAEVEAMDAHGDAATGDVNPEAVAERVRESARQGVREAMSVPDPAAEDAEASEGPAHVKTDSSEYPPGFQ